MTELPFPKNNAIKIKTLPVKQKIGTFYVGIAPASDVIKICSALPRHKKDELEEYIGIQRILNAERVKEIKEYISTWDASFPNSVILAIKKENYYFEGDAIYIKNDIESCNIIDGQHRLAGFDDQNGKDFDIILSLFPELSVEEQAYIFSVINTKMVKIPASLAQDLYALATINTPEKLAHTIARSFNMTTDNPWYKRIKILGKKEIDDIDSVISQSTFTKEIIGLICDRKDSYKIRHILHINKNNRKSLKEYYDLKKADRYVLWNAFIEGEDKFIYTILRDYFMAVKQTYPQEWDDASKILTKTTGYTALMIVFDKLVRMGFKEKDLTQQFFLKYFDKAKKSNKIKNLTSRNYNPGAIGENNLAKDILEGMDLNG